MEFEEKISVLKNPDEYFNDLIKKNIINETIYSNNKRKFSGATLLYNIIRQLLIDNKEDEVDKILERTNLNEQCSFFKKTPLFTFVSAEMGENYDVFFYLNKKDIDLSQQDKEGNTIFHFLVNDFEEKSIEKTMNFIKNFELSLFEIKNNNGITALERVYDYNGAQSKLMTSFNHLKYMQQEKKIIEENIICVDKQQLTKKRL